MPPSSGAPRWVWAVMWVSVGIGAAAVATAWVRSQTPPARAGIQRPLAPRSPPKHLREVEAVKWIDERRMLFARAEASVKNIASTSADSLRAARQTLIDLHESDSVGCGPDSPNPIRKMIAAIDHALVGKVRDEAKALAAAPRTTPRQGLAKYAEAEHYVGKAMLDARKAKSPNFEPYMELYKTLLQESDAYARGVITPEFVGSIPWKDLLSGEMARRWSKTTTYSGPACGIENGVLTAEHGVFGILDQKTDDLRHFMLDMEFQVDGVATMFFHVSLPPQNPDSRQSETFDLSSKGGPLKPNERCSLIATYIGSELKVWFPERDDMVRYENTPNWVKLRRGGIAFLIPEGTRLKVTRMRIRDLR